MREICCSVNANVAQATPELVCRPMAPASPRRMRSRRKIQMQMIPSIQKTFAISALVLHIAFAACPVVVNPTTCFVANTNIERSGYPGYTNDLTFTGRTTQDVWDASENSRSLRCRPISSTLSPHMFHVPSPMHSTKEDVSVDDNYLLKKVKRRRNRSSKKNSSQGSAHQPVQAVDGIHRKIDSTTTLSKVEEVAQEKNNNDDWFAGRSNIKSPLGAYAKLSTKELQSLTNKLLTKKRRQVGQMKASELHEASRLLSSWSKRAVKESGPMAEAILQHIMDEKAAGNQRANPTITLVNTVLIAWTKSRVRGGAKRALKLLVAMEELYRVDETNPQPDTRCYVTLITAFAKRKDFQSAKTAEQLLTRLGQLPGNERQAKHFNLVLNAYAESGHKQSGEMAERLLESMSELYRNTGDDNVKPELQSYNTVIKAHARSKRRDSARRAAKILTSMETIPDKISYSSCIDAWSKSGEKGAAERAERILKEMKMLSEDGHLDCKPDRLTYNAIINAWAASGEKDAGERSEQLLDQMQELYEAGDEEMQPDTWSYNTVIHAYANSSGRGTARKGLKVLKRMESAHIAGNPNVTPDAYSYNSAMNGLAKSREMGSAQMAEDLLERMESLSPAGRYLKNVRNVPPEALRDVRPDKISYNTAIFAWANSGDMRAAAKAESILQSMLAAYQAGDETLKPDVTTYNSLLTAWSRTPSAGAPEKAEEILDRMFQLYEAGEKDCRPDRQSFTSAINCWAKSRDRSKAKNAQRLLRRMNAFAEADESLRPNIFVYGAVLNACAFTYGRSEVKEEALKIAIETFAELNKSPHVNSNDVTYATFMRAVTTLTEKNDARRDRLIEHVFRQCCKDGQVSASVLKQLTTGAPHLYITLMPSSLGKKVVYGMVTLEDIPREWMRNVRQGRSFRAASAKSNTFRR